MITQNTAARYDEPVSQVHKTENTQLKWGYFTVIIVIYKLLLDWSYDFIALVFDYQGLFYNGKTPATQLLSWIILICAMPAFKRIFDEKSSSGNVLALLVVFSVIPTISVISFRSDYDTYYILLMSAFWAIFFASWTFFKPIHIKSLKKMESHVFYVVTFLILSLSVLIYSYINTGLRLHFNLIEVYDIRAEARGFIAPFPLNYLVSFADNLLPVLSIYFVYKRHWLAVIFAFFVIFVNFSISGQKQIVFIPTLGIIGYFAFKSGIKPYYLITFGAIIALFCILETVISNSIALNGLFTYRVLFIPAELHYSYYHYFQSHEILLFSQSLLKAFSAQNQQDIQFIIGEYSIRDYSARANNGLFSDGYMNLGVVGVIIYPVLFAWYLRVLDGAVSGLPQRIIFVIVVYVAFVLLSNTLTAALITSGLLFLIVLLYTLPRDRSHSMPPKSMFGVSRLQ